LPFAAVRRLLISVFITADATRKSNSNPYLRQG
jgi:hypothetical protein